MASPQLENGHWLRISNEIIEAMVRFALPDSEHRVLWSVIRKTWGWQKKQDRISVSQFVELTGLPDRMVEKALSSLKKRGMIVRDNTGVTSFVKDFDSWRDLSTQSTPPSKMTAVKNVRQPPSKTGEKTPSKMTDTKDNLTKDTIQKTGAGSPSAGDNPTDLIALAGTYRSDDARWPDMIDRLARLGYHPRIGKDIAGFFDGEWKRKSPRGGPWLVNGESLKGNLSFIKR